MAKYVIMAHRVSRYNVGHGRVALRKGGKVELYDSYEEAGVELKRLMRLTGASYALGIGGVGIWYTIELWEE